MRAAKSPKYPIDIVMPWVDGSDVNWLTEKNQYSDEITSSVFDHNYKDWGLLKYWFRGIEQFAPWVRYVYFVTWGHIPDWLDTDNPHLKIVKHTDFIPEQYLPTFSSHAIELNMHRIDGLSENFIYFNDDTYLIKKAKPTDFFVDGLPRDTAIVNPIAPIDRNRVAHLKLTNIAVINEHFDKHTIIKKNFFKWYNLRYGKLLPLNILFSPWGRFPGIYEKHLPVAFLKSTFEDVWNTEYELLDETCSHKFRDFKTDVNQWLIKEWQVAKGTFVPQSISCGTAVYISDLEHARSAAKIIRNQKRMMICINDNFDGDDGELQEIISLINDAMSSVFPDKSHFEK